MLCLPAAHVEVIRIVGGLVRGRVAQCRLALGLGSGRADQGAGVIRAVTAEAVGVLPQDDATPVVDEGVALDGQGAVAEAVGYSAVPARLGDIDGAVREPAVRRARAPGVVGEGVALDEGVVADLVDQRLGVVGGEIVALDAEAVVIGVGPDADAVVVMDVVVLDRHVLVLPELAAPAAAAAVELASPGASGRRLDRELAERFPVARVVVGDLVVAEHDVLRAAGHLGFLRVAGVLVSVERVLAVPGQAVVLDRVTRADHHRGARHVALDRAVRDRPVVVGVGVDRSLATRRREVLDGQVLDGNAGDASAVADEREVVLVVTGRARVVAGDDRTRGAGERVVAAGVDLRVLTAAQVVRARGEVVRGAGGQLVAEQAGVVPGGDRDRAGRRGGGTAEDFRVAAHRGRRCGQRGRSRGR